MTDQPETSEEMADVDAVVSTDDDSSNDEEFEMEDEFVEETGLGEKLKKMRAELRQAKAERDEYLTGWQKAKADYINLKKDAEETRSQLRKHIQQDCVQDLLPVIDSFHMAMAGEAWESVDATWRTGVEYIYQQLWKAFEEYGVSEIAETDIPFDPLIHEPMETEKVSADQHDQILGIIQKGYRVGDRIIRPAKVKVGKHEE